MVGGGGGVVGVGVHFGVRAPLLCAYTQKVYFEEKHIKIYNIRCAFFVVFFGEGGGEGRRPDAQTVKSWKFSSAAAAAVIENKKAYSRTNLCTFGGLDAFYEFLSLCTAPMAATPYEFFNGILNKR